MKPLIFSFFLFLLGFSLFTNDKEKELQIQEEQVMSENTSQELSKKDSLVLYSNNRIKIIE